MHSYSLDIGIRNKVLLYIFIISFFCSIPVNWVLSKLAQLLSAHIPALNDVLLTLENIGISVRSVSVLALFGIIYWVFTKYLWKTKLLIALLKVPNLNGKWIGGLVSTYKDEYGHPVKVSGEIEIDQDWEKIAIRCQYKTSMSYSDTASIYIDNRKGVLLLFSYRNENNDTEQMAEGLHEHKGFNELVYKDSTLSGKYFTNRVPGTSGTMLFIKDGFEIEEDVTPLEGVTMR